MLYTCMRMLLYTYCVSNCDGEGGNKGERRLTSVVTEAGILEK